MGGEGGRNEKDKKVYKPFPLLEIDEERRWKANTKTLCRRTSPSTNPRQGQQPE